MRIGPYAIGEQSRRRADGGRHRSSVPPALQAARRGLRGVGDGRLESASAAYGKIAAAHRSRGRGRADRRADRRRRSSDDGRRRALQRRSRRADHRHQHGLPGEESLQRRGGFRAARERAAGRRDRRGRRARCRRSGHAEDPHRAIDPTHRNALAIARIAEDAGIAALAVHGRTRACAFVGRGRIRHDPRRQGARCAFRSSPTATSIRRSRRSEVLALHRRRCDHDRPRRAGPAVDLSRNRALPRHRNASAAADGRGGAGGHPASISTTTTRSTARRSACASRASTWAGTRRSSRAARRSAARSTGWTPASRSGAAVEPLLRSARRKRRAARLRRASRRQSRTLHRSLRRDARQGSTGRGGPRRVRKTLRINGSNEIGRRRREVARRIFPQARRRAAARHLRHGDRACRARADRVGDGRARTATRRRRPTCSA